MLGLPNLPFVSIIIPVYNGGATITLCLDSLLTLDYPKEKLEIVIVDNNSSDDTALIVAKYPFLFVHERRTQSSYAARNTGIASSKGEILAFTDSDCIVDPAWIKQIVTAFADDEVAAVAGKIISVPGVSLVERFTAEVDPLGKHTLGGMLSLVTANVAYRRNILDQFGGFNQKMTTGADVDLGWRTQQLPGKKVVYVENAIVNHKHRTTVDGLRRQFHRYGYSEILLDTIYRHDSFYPRKPIHQIGIMAKQFGALGIYLVSVITRRIKHVLSQKDEGYLQWPLLWLYAESSNLAGKLAGLQETKFFTRNPFQSS